MSNETPKPSPKKTKSARKYVWLLSLIVVAGVIGTFVALRLSTRIVTQQGPTPVVLHLGGHVYMLEVARSEAEQEKGLGDRKSMDKSSGMVFPYASQDQRCFWMKDMHFPLDIIWVSSVKTVIHVEPNLSPSTYPQTYCFPAQYVIELSAGEAAKNHLLPSQRLDF